jgi:cytochrome c peroxidase
VTLKRVVPGRREGQALVLGEGEDALYLADEDHKKLRRVEVTPAMTTVPPVGSVRAFTGDEWRTLPGPLPFSEGQATETSLDLPGRPAQVLSLGDRLLVTVRDPGLLLVVSAGPGMKELARVPLPADAWGLTVSADGAAAYVTSAWSRKLSRVDLSGEAPKVSWSLDTAREPRAVVVTPDGRWAYVAHLIGSDVTRVDLTGAPRAERIFLAPDPLETLAGEKLTASLGYAALLDPEGRRFFVARHAMGAFWAWQGRPTVDVLVAGSGEALIPERKGQPFGTFTSEQLGQMRWITDHAGTRAESDGVGWVQPRAMIYRKKTRHLLVASEGLALLAELDAMSVAPGLITNRLYRLGGLVEAKLPAIKFPPRCGAPTGVALSRDEAIAWVYCRTTDNLVAVRLTEDGQRAHRTEIRFIEYGEERERPASWGPFAYLALAVPPADPELALGRRLFFDAADPVVSERMACAGCHPEGRDDGMVWREQTDPLDKRRSFLAGPSLSFRPDQDDKPQNYGVPFQTPMLAGRVQAPGPYGWHGESPDLAARIREGFRIHRSMPFDSDGVTAGMRATPLARFLREGLVPPPQEKRPLTEQEAQGEKVFLSEKAKCSICHPPDREYTDRSLIPMVGFRTLPLFTEDKNIVYKTPSLRYVGSTEPYYHDGSARTLDELVAKNMDRMGKTSHLTEQERAALVAFLKTL